MKKVCYTIDTEGDSANSIFSTYFGIEKVLPKILELFEFFNVKATFFIQEDMFVKIGSRFPNLLERLQSSGHEIGYHAHGLIGSNEERQKEIITNGLNRLKDMGYKPVSFRAGRYHFNARILKILEKNSIKYDSSVVPDLNEVVDGIEWNNHVGAYYTPYFPSYKDHCKKGSSKILEIPINRIRNGGPVYGNDKVLYGFKPYEKNLFDYFNENVDDKVIVISIHPWDGLYRHFHRFRKKLEFDNKKRDKYMTKLVGTGLITLGCLVNKRYIKSFNNLLEYISQKNIEFVTIKAAGEYIKRLIGND